MVTTKFEELADNLPQFEAWLQRGEEIELTRGGRALARVVPAVSKTAPRALVKADFAGRMKEIWGDAFFSDEEVSAMRAAELGERS